MAPAHIEAVWPRAMTRYPDGRYVILAVPDGDLRYLKPGAMVQATRPRGDTWTLTAVEVGDPGMRDVWPDRRGPRFCRWHGFLMERANWDAPPRHAFVLFQTIERRPAEPS